MEILSQLSKITAKSQKRRGRGAGSGVGGHTTGRGAKGDNVRGKTALTFEGTKIKKSWIKRAPFLRGKHRVLPSKKPVIIGLDQLEKWFKNKDVVDLASLGKKINAKEIKRGVKILGDGQITKALQLKGLLCSKTAKDKIIAAGGSAE